MSRPSNFKLNPSSPSPSSPYQPTTTTQYSPTLAKKYNPNSNHSNGDSTPRHGLSRPSQDFHVKLHDDSGGREEDSDTEDHMELSPLQPPASSPNGEAVVGQRSEGEDWVLKSKLSETEDEESDYLRYSYGWSGFRPRSLQFMSNRNAFLVVFCLTCILQGTFHTYFVAVITTLEKLFSIPSRTTGMLMSATEIGQVSSSLLLPYYVSSRHRPHWISYGSVLFSIATLLTVTPHLLYPPAIPKAASVSDNMCVNQFASNSQDNLTSLTFLLQNHSSNDSYTGNSSVTSGDPFCPDDRDPPPYFLFGILFLCLLCIGLGQTAVYTLGIPYLDDNVASRDSPLYFSITIGVRILGPVFGFILGSFCTRLFIYPWKEPEGMTPSNPRWLGAWWLGMILISSLLLINSILIYGFPQSLKITSKGTTNQNISKAKSKTKKEKEKQQQTLVSTTTTTSLVSPTESALTPLTNEGSERSSVAPPPTASSPTPIAPPPKLSNFPMTLKRLFQNRILMLRTCSSVLHLLPISGLYTFLPKYLESQFRLAAFEANIYTGIAGILVMGIGIFSSGVYIRKKEPDAKTVALWVAASAIIYAAGMAALMFTGCDQQDFNIGSPISPSCKTTHCTSCADIYSPVCADNQTYLSICHAGCHTYNNLTSEYECDCVSSAPTPGLCPSTCNLFYLYSVIFIVIVLVHSSSEVGSMLLTLRCVHPSDKAMALGLVQCAIGLLGNVPCPIIYGSIVDSTCTIWGASDCRDPTSQTGHCWLYDSTKFRIYFNGTTSFFMFLASLFDIAIYFKAKDIQITTSN